MKVGFIANSGWYLSNFRDSTIERLSKRYNVVCFYPFENKEQKVESLSAKKCNIYLNPTSVNLVKEFFSLISIFLNIMTNRPKILFSFNPKTNLYALISCYLLRIPCVPNVSGVGDASNLGGIAGKLYRVLSKFFYRRSHFIFFQNFDDLDKFVALGWADPENSCVIPGSGVDLKRFRPRKRDGYVTFLMASRLIKPKGVVEYVEASRNILESYNQIKFYLAGIHDKSLRSVDTKFIEGLSGDGDVEFLGHVEDMPRLLDNIDCVVLPSYYPEGTPRCLLEAIGAGKIVITTNTPGCRDVVVVGENGYLVEPRSISQLEEAIRKVVSMSRSQIEEMQVFSRLLAESNFDEEVVIRRYIEVVEKFTNT
ncbi:glycosyltransferase family 4 protein [Halomonas sp. OfavH-34-E]|uniref:glycosyltransferase family 4 protein n=1 Tax=Halomonas sp. OfavH-34-E TaxID=2954491 RepID=UPI00209834EE|nr:glycosyltransferase family 4 protein [Halomonas sp. OfavH-34-E]MCO7214907.1 glycosyltransferase family 4 protein [Halomonas sp. OfavH-34-E]